jgi:hypothetical protein
MLSRYLKFLSVKNKEKTAHKTMNKIYKSTALFETLYKKAFTFLKLGSKRGIDVQVDLEVYFDQIAGPMTQFYEKGNYEYVFKDKEDRFQGV